MHVVVFMKIDSLILLLCVLLGNVQTVEPAKNIRYSGVWTELCSRSTLYALAPDPHSGKSATIRESNHGSGVCKEHYA